MNLYQKVYAATGKIINKQLDKVSFAIWDDPDSPGGRVGNRQRPNYPYCVMNIINMPRIGLESVEYKKNNEYDLVSTIKQIYTIIVSLNFYKKYSMQSANDVYSGFIKESSSDIMYEYNLGLASRSAIRNLSEKLDDGYEERAQFDVTYNVIKTDHEVIPVIKSVGIDYKLEAGNDVLTGKIEVP